MKRGELTLLCDPRMYPALLRRLRGQDCEIVCVPGDFEWDKFAAAWQHASARTVVNLCTTSSALSAKLSAQCKKRGITWLDAPLTGVPRDAMQGTMTVIVSGPKSAYRQVLPLLQMLGNKVFYVGKQAGAAQLMQQINGSLASTLLAVACEIYVTGVRAGLSPKAMAQIFSNGSGRNAASAQIVPQQVVTRRFQHGKHIADAYRELTLMNEAADRHGVTMWVGGKTKLLYGLAAQLGKPSDDITRLITHYEHWAKVKVQTKAARAPSQKIRN